MDRRDAMDWAPLLKAYEDALVSGDGKRVDELAREISDDLVECISRAAELGGWYSEWEQAMGRDETQD